MKSAKDGCYVYIFAADDVMGTCYKIGISNSPQSRFNSVKSPFGTDARILTRFLFRDREKAKAIESLAHEMGEEFRTEMVIGQGNGNTEWFFLPDDTLNEIISFLYASEKLNRWCQGRLMWKEAETLAALKFLFENDASQFPSLEALNDGNEKDKFGLVPEPEFIETPYDQ